LRHGKRNVFKGGKIQGRRGSETRESETDEREEKEKGTGSEFVSL
jgi:hypothetical protein